MAYRTPARCVYLVAIQEPSCAEGVSLNGIHTEVCVCVCVCVCVRACVCVRTMQLERDTVHMGETRAKCMDGLLSELYNSWRQCHLC